MIKNRHACRGTAGKPGFGEGRGLDHRRDRRQVCWCCWAWASKTTQSDADYLVDKIVGLRIFEDEEEKMNRSVVDAGGAVLAVSQFTLYGDVKRGKRPSFDAAARPERARELYEYFVNRVRSLGVRCETGVFQAMMEVELVNSGPVTILIDSKKQF